MERFYSVGGVVAVLMLASCAGQSQFEDYQFRAVASDDGSKRFQYVLPAIGEGVEPSSRGNFAKMRDVLGRYLEHTQYCLDGFFVYDETFDGLEYLLHGECRDSQ